MAGKSEKRIMNESLVGISSIGPDVMVWRNNTGMAWQGDRVGTFRGQKLTIEPGMIVLRNARPITFGLAGSADIMGVAGGVAIADESKTLKGKQAEQQKKFQAAFERAGGRYNVSRSAEESIEFVRGVLQRLT